MINHGLQLVCEYNLNDFIYFSILNSLFQFVLLENMVQVVLRDVIAKARNVTNLPESAWTMLSAWQAGPAISVRVRNV